MKKGCVIFGIFLCLCIQVYFTIPTKKSPNTTSVTIKIGVSINDEYDTFVSNLLEQIMELCQKKEEETGVSIFLDVVCANGSQLTQNNQVEEFASQGYDAVCINLVNRTNPSIIIDTAQNADMPIVFFNREPVKEDLERWDQIYYVGAKAEEPGRMQGQILLDALEKNNTKVDRNCDGVLQYVLLEGETGHKDALLRSESALRTLEESGYSLKKLGDEFANWKRDQAKSKMQELLDKYPYQIELVLSNNDAMALGAIDALNARKVTEWPVIVGVDGIEEALQMVRDQWMLGTVYNDAISQASAIVDLAYALARKQPIPPELPLEEGKYILFPYAVIDYENVQEYMVE